MTNLSLLPPFSKSMGKLFMKQINTVLFYIQTSVESLPSEEQRSRFSSLPGTDVAPRPGDVASHSVGVFWTSCVSFFVGQYLTWSSAASDTVARCPSKGIIRGFLDRAEEEPRRQHVQPSFFLNNRQSGSFTSTHSLVTVCVRKRETEWQKHNSAPTIADIGQTVAGRVPLQAVSHRKRG